MIPFAKAHACGNDFLIVEEEYAGSGARAELAQHLCARNTGVGADGVEFFTWTGDRSGEIKLYNADGSVAEISGNGTRCVAAWMAHQKHASVGETLTIDTDAGRRECRVLRADGHRFQISSSMGVPTIQERTVVLASGEAVSGAVVSTGNPHFVIFVNEPDFVAHGLTWHELGHEICHHSDFPNETNVEFVRVLGASEIEIRIFERGVGPTTSSGTGTCATATATIAMLGGDKTLRVVAPGGAQRVDWPARDAEIVLTGPAELICYGEAHR